MNEIAFMTDLHLNDILATKYKIDSRQNVETAFQDIYKRGIKRLVFGGDYGNPDSLEWLKTKIDVYDFEFYCILGNHDLVHDLKRVGLYPLQIENTYYCIEFGNARCIFLDSSSGRIDEQQLNWLKYNIEESTKPISIFTHYPIFDCGNSGMDQKYPLLNRDVVMSNLVNENRRMNIYCGHYHMKYDQSIGDINQNVNPGMIMQIKSVNGCSITDSFDFGYRIVDLGSNRNDIIIFSGTGEYD
jgi:3',5'-cyclic-AMP phosphodiesterase